MTEEISSPVVDPVAPVESASVEATTSAPVPETPAADVPNVETTPEAPAPETTVEPTAPETILGAEKPVEEAKPEEKTGEEAPVEETKPETPEEVALPTYEAFTLPEGITVEADKMGEFTSVLAEFENTTKASHEEVQKLGQQLVDRHIAELNRYTESLTHAWNKQKQDDWNNFLKDPEFANRTDTVGNAAVEAISVYGGTTEQQKEFRELMETRGVGNHPAMIRLLSNIMIAKANPKPLAAPQIASTAKISKVQKMYGNKG